MQVVRKELILPAPKSLLFEKCHVDDVIDLGQMTLGQGHDTS